jgi:hypothetical protein
MAGHWDSTTSGDSFRFFSPEQVDKILREGSKRGRAGSHAAIERILKHEPGLERAELWQRIRQLKHTPREVPFRRAVWSLDDDRLLREGYERGWSGKQEAVRELLKRHPDWRPHVIWKRAAKFGFVQKRLRRAQERSQHPWSEHDDQVLLNLTGYKDVRVIGRMLRRSPNAVRSRLRVLGKSSRTHKEGYARRALAEELHLGSRTIRRLIIEGLLEVRDPRITKRSLDDLVKSKRGSGAADEHAHKVGVPTSEQQAAAGVLLNCDSLEPGRNDGGMVSGRSSRAKRFWAETARTLGVNVETVGQYIAQGALKLCDPRITERSLRSFCRRYGSLMNYEFLNKETRAWLKDSMDWVPNAGEPAAKQLQPFRRHARVVRRCEGCGRDIRGNAFFRHMKSCGKSTSRGSAMKQLATENGENAP